MNGSLLLTSMILAWAAFLLAFFQRHYELPRWFKRPPLPAEIMRRQVRWQRRSSVILSVLFLVVTLAVLVLTWSYSSTRKHVIGSLVCFLVAAFLNGVYLNRKTAAFSQSEPGNVQYWLGWVSLRNILLLFSALFITIAYNHF